jgi:hypothetical protein
MKVYIEGVRALRKLAESDPPISAEPLRRGLKRASGMLAAHVISDAPTRTGRLKNRVRQWVSNAKWPRRARVYANPISKTGGKPFRYGMALNYGKVVARKTKTGRVRAYQWHYAGTGRLTHGWFSKWADILRVQIVGIMAEATNEIVDEWNSR